MSHYRVTMIHGHVQTMDAIEGMVIECDAPSAQDAAEVLFTAANRGDEAPSGVEIVEPLKGCSMTVGDLAIISDLADRPNCGTMLWCDLDGWRNGGPAPGDSPAALLAEVQRNDAARRK